MFHQQAHNSRKKKYNNKDDIKYLDDKVTFNEYRNKYIDEIESAKSLPIIFELRGIYFNKVYRIYIKSSEEAKLGNYLRMLRKMGKYFLRVFFDVIIHDLFGEDK